MNMREKFKKLFTLAKKSHDGFTLVELIVVMAILAVLGGIGIPAYSAYVEEANITADETLAAEVKHALMLGYYDNNTYTDEGVLKNGGYVILSTDEEPKCSDDEIKAALTASLGDWSSLRLKYEWENTATSDISAAYNDSSYSGNEASLLGEVGKLTNLLSGLIADNDTLVGDNFGSFLSDKNLSGSDAQTKANAAVLYAADKISENYNKDQGKNIIKAFETYYTSGYSLGRLTMDLQEELGTFGACAALYAHAEAYCNYSKLMGSTNNLLERFHNTTLEISDKDSALTKVADAFQVVIEGAASEPSISEAYIGNEIYKKDVQAYIASMLALDNNSNAFNDRLGNTDCYTDGTATNLLLAYVTAGTQGIKNGEIAIVTNISNGNMTTTAVPLDYQK